ncbi:hypothetical protein ABK040_013574 [Willaertia magna]
MPNNLPKESFLDCKICPICFISNSQCENRKSECNFQIFNGQSNCLKEFKALLLKSENNSNNCFSFQKNKELKELYINSKNTIIEKERIKECIIKELKNIICDKEMKQQFKKNYQENLNNIYEKIFKEINNIKEKREYLKPIRSTRYAGSYKIFFENDTISISSESSNDADNYQTNNSLKEINISQNLIIKQQTARIVSLRRKKRYKAYKNYKKKKLQNINKSVTGTLPLEFDNNQSIDTMNISSGDNTESDKTSNIDKLVNHTQSTLLNNLMDTSNDIKESVTLSNQHSHQENTIIEPIIIEDDDDITIIEQPTNETEYILKEPLLSFIKHNGEIARKLFQEGSKISVNSLKAVVMEKFGFDGKVFYYDYNCGAFCILDEDALFYVKDLNKILQLTTNPNNSSFVNKINN